MEGYKYTGFTDVDNNKLFDGHIIDFDVDSSDPSQGRRCDVIVFFEGDYILRNSRAPLYAVMGSFGAITMRIKMQRNVKLIGFSY